MLKLGALLLLLTLLACTDSPPRVTEEIAVDQALGSEADPGLSRAVEPRTFSFPHDHGAHPEFQHEWWYLTGNLAATTGRRFGPGYILPYRPRPGGISPHLELAHPTGLDGPCGIDRHERCQASRQGATTRFPAWRPRER